MYVALSTSRSRSRSPPRKQPRVTFNPDEEEEGLPIMASTPCPSASNSNSFSLLERFVKEGVRVARSQSAGTSNRVKAMDQPEMTAVDDEPAMQSTAVFVIDKRPSGLRYASPPPMTSKANERSRSSSRPRTQSVSGKRTQRYFDPDILKPNHLVDRQITSHGPQTPGELRWHINGKPTTMAKKRSEMSSAVPAFVTCSAVIQVSWQPVDGFEARASRSVREVPAEEGVLQKLRTEGSDGQGLFLSH